MPTALLLETKPTRDRWWTRADAYRALAYQLFLIGNETEAVAVHNATGLKPFTLAILPDESCVWVRVTALTEAMETLLRASVVRLSEGAPLLLQRLVVPIGDVQTECAPWEEQVPYTDLYSLPFCSQVNLFFATPTAFAQSHLPDLPLPLPEKLVQSWFQRWNTFAPASLCFPEALCGSLSARVALSQCAISTEVVHRRKSLQIGFVGEVCLRAYEKPSAPWSEEERRCFAALVAYSRFCGTGLGTTQGFGLTMPWEAQKRIPFREARRKGDA